MAAHFITLSEGQKYEHLYPNDQSGRCILQSTPKQNEYCFTHKKKTCSHNSGHFFNVTFSLISDVQDIDDAVYWKVAISSR